MLVLTYTKEDSLNRVHPFRAGPTFRALRLATVDVTPVEMNCEIVIFASFLMVGLFPPFFNFFMEVLGKYQLCMAQASLSSHICVRRSRG